jgi:hypothetical protein
MPFDSRNQSFSLSSSTAQNLQAPYSLLPNQLGSQSCFEHFSRTDNEQIVQCNVSDGIEQLPLVNSKRSVPHLMRVLGREKTGAKTKTSQFFASFPTEELTFSKTTFYYPEI